MTASAAKATGPPSQAAGPDEGSPPAQPQVTNGRPRNGRVRTPFAIQTFGLGKSYGEIRAVDELSLRVPWGGVTGFVGPNGSGKTTTIRMLLGLVAPSRGNAFVLGRSIADPTTYLSRVGALIESPAFYPQLSGRRNLHALALLGGHDVRRIPALLRLVGLAERGDDAYRGYSLGMKQRLGIAAALLPDPDLLVLDEPTNGLDPAGIREIRGLLRRIGQLGKTVFVSSHLLSEIQRTCDHLIVLRRGRLVFQGPVNELLTRRIGLVAVTEDPRQQEQLLRFVQEAGYQAESRGSHVFIHAPPHWAGTLNREAMAAGIVLSELRAERGDLEETVLDITGRGSP